MASKPFHLAWFMNFTPGDWTGTFAAGAAPWDGGFYVDMAKALERACFDYIMIEDTRFAGHVRPVGQQQNLAAALCGAA